MQEQQPQFTPTSPLEDYLATHGIGNINASLLARDQPAWLAFPHEGLLLQTYPGVYFKMLLRIRVCLRFCCHTISDKYRKGVKMCVENFPLFLFFSLVSALAARIPFFGSVPSALSV